MSDKDTSDTFDLAALEVFAGLNLTFEKAIPMTGEYGPYNKYRYKVSPIDNTELSLATVVSKRQHDRIRILLLTTPGAYITVTLDEKGNPILGAKKGL